MSGRITALPMTSLVSQQIKCRPPIGEAREVRRGRQWGGSLPHWPIRPYGLDILAAPGAGSGGHTPRTRATRRTEDHPLISRHVDRKLMEMRPLGPR